MKMLHSLTHIEMKYLSSLLLFCSFFFVSCSDNNDEPKPNQNTLIGYWAITHIKTIEQQGGIHSTTDKDVPPHGLDSYASAENYRYDVLIFDEDLVTVRGDMPNKPKGRDFDLDTTDGNIEYLEALENWNNSIGQYTDQFDCPVGRYHINDDDLFIGTLNMGKISFVSDNEFTLDYTKSLNSTGDYRRLVYTYSRIYSLTL